MSIYDDYSNLLKNEENYLNFKTTPVYNGILEHVNPELGYDYLKIIQNEFNLPILNIIEFCDINDKFGSPKKIEYITKENITINVSPSSLRYIYHALIILKYFKTTSCKSFVEVGCGYGGLFLSINYFSKFLNIEINEYSFIDLPDVCLLIKHYLKLNSENIHIKYDIHHSNLYGSDIEKTNLFLISNYCFTEIDEFHRNQYCEKLLNKCENGFIIWQPVALSLDKVNILNKKVTYEKERPKTFYIENYFVYF